MINFTTLLRNGERVIRIVPFVKDLIPSNKDGLNSLIQSDSNEILKLNKKIKEQDEALYAKKNEICQLRKKIEELEKYVWDLEQNVENCKYQINLLTKALIKEE
jgi:peptidoglycan hydrolase CwlO-like protein